MNWDKILFTIAAILVVTLFGSVLLYIVLEDYGEEGIITDKFILPRFTGEPVYYFVLDNETDIRTFENDYYKYQIGDYYKPYR